jgi:CHAD domain-containing protein
MAFCIEHQESARKAVRRVILTCLNNACKQAAHLDPESIHLTRRDLKKVRAVLTLVTGCDKQNGRKILEPVRRAAKCLGPARDAHVVTTTLEKLRKEDPKLKCPHLAKALKRDHRRELRDLRKRKSGKAVMRFLRKAMSRAEKLKFSSNGWTLIGPGIKESLREARACFREAERLRTAEAFHAWRGRAKDLGYNLAFLRSIAPEKLKQTSVQLDRIGELLGEAHDLQLLQDALPRKSNDRDLKRQADRLLSVITPRQRLLEEKALRLGDCVLRDDPAAIETRLHGYWRQWRGWRRLHAR